MYCCCAADAEPHVIELRAVPVEAAVAPHEEEAPVSSQPSEESVEALERSGSEQPVFETMVTSGVASNGSSAAMFFSSGSPPAVASEGLLPLQLPQSFKAFGPSPTSQSPSAVVASAARRDSGTSQLTGSAAFYESMNTFWPGKSGKLAGRQLRPSHEDRLDQDSTLTIEDPLLLRAVPSNVVLRTSWLWRDHVGGEETFATSKPMTQIGIFFSHSWKTPGWLKMIGIMYQLNVSRAVVAAVALHICLHVFELAGAYTFPIPCTHGGSRMFAGQEVVGALRPQLHCILPLVAFFVMLWWGQELPWGRSLCFLDKCCIHQSDVAKKAVGIKQLGAFIRCSESMLVLWQPVYFTRLWCVYELAAFVHINDGDCRRVRICPLKLYVFGVAMVLVSSIGIVSSIVLFPWTLYHPLHAKWVAETVPEAAQYMYLVLVFFFLYGSIVAPLSPFFWIFCKWHTKDRRELLRQVRSFVFEKAQCEEEGDRSYVRARIEQWFGGIAPFEEFVQTRLAQQIEELLLRQGPIPYHLVVIGALPLVLLAITAMVHAFEDGIPGRINLLIYWPSVFFFWGPIAVNCIMRLADTSFGDGAPNRCFLRRNLAGSMAATLIFPTCLAIPSGLVTPAAPVWFAILLFVLGAVLTSLLYLPGDILKQAGAAWHGRGSVAKGSPVAGPLPEQIGE